MTMTSADAATGGQGAAALLDRTRTAVQPQLRSTVETLPGSIRRVAMYH
ncbi:polyprenyl synthetase family protein, partial [Streptomyces sp. SID2131]|nr:polyprenyl synthetase family protein [Streptomyces sp. SID2131]